MLNMRSKNNVSLSLFFAASTTSWQWSMSNLYKSSQDSFLTRILIFFFTKLMFAFTSYDMLFTMSHLSEHVLCTYFADECDIARICAFLSSFWERKINCIWNDSSLIAFLKILTLILIKISYSYLLNLCFVNFMSMTKSAILIIKNQNESNNSCYKVKFCMILFRLSLTNTNFHLFICVAWFCRNRFLSFFNLLSFEIAAFSLLTNISRISLWIVWCFSLRLCYICLRKFNCKLVRFQ